MSDAAVNFLMKNYKLDEMKARAILAFYKDILDQPQIIGVPGLSPEEPQIGLQQQMAINPTAYARQTPGIFYPTMGAFGGGEPGPDPVEREREVGLLEQVYRGAERLGRTIWGLANVLDPFWVWSMSTGVPYAISRWWLPAVEAGTAGPAQTAAWGVLQRVGNWSPPGLMEKLGILKPETLGSVISRFTGQVQPGTTGTTTGITPIVQAQQGFWSRAGAGIRGIGQVQPGTAGATTGITPTVQAQQGLWSRAGAGIRGIGQGISANAVNLKNYLFGGGGSLGALYGLSGSTAIAAAIPVAGIIGARTLGGIMAPEWNAELSRQGYNEFIRPWFPTLMGPPKNYEELQMMQAAAPYWQGWANAWNEFTSVVGNIGNSYEELGSWN